MEKLSKLQGLRMSKFWFFLLLYFCQVWLQHLSEVLESQSSCCLLLCSSCHLRSTLYLVL
jgi:hypothetical protein